MSAPMLHRRMPPAWLAPYLSRITGYAEHGRGLAGAHRLARHSGDRLPRGRLPRRLRRRQARASRARVIRFRHAARLATAAPPDWSDIAAACGCADQALAGCTPTAWAAARS